MSEKCVYCHQRTGKRECPALGGLICPVCCGEHRATEINCPPDCRYFQQGEEFQQEKRAEPYREEWVERNSDLIEDQNYELLNTISALERTVYFFYKENQLLTDDQVIFGLTELEKRFKPIEVPTNNLELTQFAYQALSDLIDSGKINKKVLREALGRTIDLAEDFSDGSRELVQGLTGGVEQDYELPDEEEMSGSAPGESLITTPEQLSDLQ